VILLAIELFLLLSCENQKRTFMILFGFDALLAEYFHDVAVNIYTNK